MSRRSTPRSAAIRRPARDSGSEPSHPHSPAVLPPVKPAPAGGTQARSSGPSAPSTSARASGSDSVPGCQCVVWFECSPHPRERPDGLGPHPDVRRTQRAPAGVNRRSTSPPRMPDRWPGSRDHGGHPAVAGASQTRSWPTPRLSTPATDPQVAKAPPLPDFRRPARLTRASGIGPYSARKASSPRERE